MLFYYKYNDTMFIEHDYAQYMGMSLLAMLYILLNDT